MVRTHGGLVSIVLGGFSPGHLFSTFGYREPTILYNTRLISKLTERQNDRSL